MKRLLLSVAILTFASVADAGSFTILTSDGNLIWGNSNQYGGSAFNSYGGITTWSGQLPSYGYPAYNYGYNSVYRPYGYYQTPPRFGHRW